MTRSRHFIHIMTLVLILLGGIFAFFYAQGNRTIQVVVGIVTIAAYVAWGVMHHGLQGELHRKVVVEYLLMGAVALILLLTVLSS